MDGLFIFGLALAAFVILAFFKTVNIVPQQTAYVVERLGRYNRVLDAGLHILIPLR
jgi:regulator of protease activity HflC (stomatin/prohibitin superfamily)